MNFCWSDVIGFIHPEHVLRDESVVHCGEAPVQRPCSKKRQQATPGSLLGGPSEIIGRACLSRGVERHDVHRQTEQRAELTREEFLALALAEDTSSLNPEHRITANLRDRGVGLVPRVVSLDADTRCARLAAGAIMGAIRVPFGWHVIDEGRRTLVFDADGLIQVNLNQRQHEGASIQEFARGLLDQYLAVDPTLPVVEATLSSIACSGVRGVDIEGEKLDQCFFVRNLGRDGTYLVAKASGSAEHSIRALDLAGDWVATFEAMETSPILRTAEAPLLRQLPDDTLLGAVAVACACDPAFHRPILPAGGLSIHACLRCGTVTCARSIGDDGRFTGEAWTAWRSIALPDGVID